MGTDDSLETGYGDNTPDGDNLLNDFARGHAAAFRALAVARGDRMLEQDDLQLTLLDNGSPSPYVNPAVLRRPLDDHEWRDAATVIHEFFAQAPGGPFIVFSAWPTPDLRSFGFDLIGHPPMMVRPASPVEIPTIAGFEIRQVRDLPNAEDYEAVLVHGYPVPELQPFQPGCFLPERALTTPGWTHYLGVLDGRAVATASAFIDNQHVKVENVSALNDVRGRGIGYAVTAAATATKTDRPAMLIASDAGQPTYDRMGYVALLRYTLWLGHRRPASKTGSHGTQIPQRTTANPARYRLSARHIPRGSVLAVPAPRRREETSLSANGRREAWARSGTASARFEGRNTDNMGPVGATFRADAKEGANNVNMQGANIRTPRQAVGAAHHLDPSIEHHPAVVAQWERRASDAQLRLADRITALAGSMAFVYLHIVLFATWMLILEKSPWPTLTLIVSLEAIFLSTFVMIGQNRQATFQQAKADSDFQNVSTLLDENTRLTRVIHELTKELHAHLIDDAPPR
jgi:hypothetical protein